MKRVLVMLLVAVALLVSLPSMVLASPACTIEFTPIEFYGQTYILGHGEASGLVPGDAYWIFRYNDGVLEEQLLTNAAEDGQIDTGWTADAGTYLIEVRASTPSHGKKDGNGPPGVVLASCSGTL